MATSTNEHAKPGSAGERVIYDTPDQEQCCFKFRAHLEKIHQNDKFRLAMSLILGQFLSLLLCGTGVTSQLLQTTHSIHLPTTQSFINYVLLGTVFGITLAVRKDFVQVLQKNWWKYIILGVIDVEANYMVVRAYEYTNLTTIQLLDSFTIACVMVLSFFFLRVRYKIINFMGVSLALIGIACLVLATVTSSGSSAGPNPLLGDLLCLGGSALYAISNVAQEFLVKNHSIAEFLGLIGVTGSVVSGIQLIIVERESLARVEWSYDVGLIFFGFGVCMFLFYSVMPHVMKFSSAVVVNLSLLTADIYTLFFGLYLFHFMFSFFYIVALFLIIAGVFIYNIRQPSVSKGKKDVISYFRSSKPSVDLHRNIEQNQSSLEAREGLGLRALLESSTITTSTSKHVPPVTKTKSKQRNSSRNQKASESATKSPALPSYGSVSLEYSINSSTSGKSRLLSATHHPTE